jgi:hypothetical protein
MSFFKNLFGGNDPEAPKEQAPARQEQQPATGQKSALVFGRYTDANKSAEQLRNWNEAVKLFGEKKYMDAHEAFFNYIRDAASDNVQFTRNGERIDFTIHQGSKLIKGTSTPEKVTAEVNIARFEKPSVAFMRKLMDLNFGFQYSRFAFKDDLICMKFTSHMLDASPNKMYYSLKEISTKADRQDNLLVDEFKMLQSVDQEHVEHEAENVKEVKYKYTLKWINDALEQAAKLDEAKFAGAISFYLLNAAYKIDYLICPEGGLMTDMEKISGIYFAKDNKPFEEKNRAIIAEYKKILERPKEFFMNSFYNTRATFGIINASDQKTVADLVYNEIGNTTWYVQNNYPDVVRTIYEYIPGYCFFNYGMYTGTMAILHLLIELQNQDFFGELGFAPLMHNGVIDPEKVNARIAAINQKEVADYPNFNFMATNLVYNGNFNDFCASYLKEFDYLNLSKEKAPATK